MRTTRLATAIAASASLALTLTACGGEDDNGAAKPTQASSAAASATSTSATSPSLSASASVPETGRTAPTADGGSTGSQTSGGTSSNGNGKNPGSGGSTAKPADCATGSLKFTAGEVSRPVNHIVIKATNNSSRPCNLFAFPLLAFEEDAQAATAEIEESRPQTVVTLAPGATAYAGVTTSSGDGSGERSVRSSVIGLHLQGRNGGSVDKEVRIPAPGGSLYVEPGAAEVTYWQDSATDALTW